MNPKEGLDPRILETLSAYLDGTLEGAEKAGLEARLIKEENLRLSLGELRSVRDSLRSLPLRKPPRPLALTPAMAGKGTGKAGVFSPRRMAFGSALASLAFVCVLAADILSRGALQFAASAPRPVSVNEAAVAPPSSMDNTGVGKSSATGEVSGPAATAAPAQAMTPTATLSTNSPGTGGTGFQIETPTPEPSPTISAPTEAPTTRRLVATPLPASPGFPPTIRLDFHIVAPFLEAIFGAGAVAFAALALVFRR
jgi:hypothetical protein